MKGAASFEVGSHRAALYSFVPGRDGYEARIDRGGLRTIAVTLRALHRISPTVLSKVSVPVERFDPRFRLEATAILDALESRIPADQSDEHTDKEAIRAWVLTMLDSFTLIEGSYEGRYWQNRGIGQLIPEIVLERRKIPPKN